MCLLFLRLCELYFIVCSCLVLVCFFFFKQKTAYDMRISDWSSDVCSSDLNCGLPGTSGFVGEFTVIMGAVEHNFWIGLLAATALIWGASYSLWIDRKSVV